MANDAAGLTFRDKHFSKFVLGAIALIMATYGLSERDARALLLSAMPQALAVNEVQALTETPANTFPVDWGRGRSIPRGTAAPRNALTGGGTPASVPGAGGGGGGGAGEAPIVDSGTGPSALPVSGTSAPVGATQPFGGGLPSIGSGSSPLIAQVPGTPTTPTTPGNPGTNPGDTGTTPVVPAVPEPASWLLMIIGIGALGTAMRRRRDAAVGLKAASAL